MKNFLLAVFGVGTLAVFAPAQSSKGSSSDNAAEQQIRKILNERAEIFRLPKASASGRLSRWEEEYLDKDAITTDTINRVFTGSEKIATDKKEGAESESVESLSVTDERLHVFGDIVVANYRWNVTAKANGQTVTDSSLFTTVFIRRKGKCMIVADHISHAG